MAFADFNAIDTTGENPLTGMIAAISKDIDGIVTCLDELQHGLEDGDVTFLKLMYMSTILYISLLLGLYTFSIGDTSNFGDYISGGIFTQVKQPKTISFKSFRESLKKPELLFLIFGNWDRSGQLHLAKELNEQCEEKVELSNNLIKQLAYGAAGDLSPMAAVFGESLPDNVKFGEEECAPCDSRYDGQIAVFGKEFRNTIANFRIFLVGSGAIGCEMLKNWAMMGLGTGTRGANHVTDMDTIEKSNLNQQFLFRPNDVGIVLGLKPKIYNDDFFETLDVVTNALDNVDA
ncbi:9300_t:CDS:2, partial [Gigaspora rosea]